MNESKTLVGTEDQQSLSHEMFGVPADVGQRIYEDLIEMVGSKECYDLPWVDIHKDARKKYASNKGEAEWVTYCIGLLNGQQIMMVAMESRQSAITTLDRLMSLADSFESE